MIDVTFANYLRTVYRWCNADSDPRFYTRLDLGFEYLSKEDREMIRDGFPTLEQRQREWGDYVLHLPLDDRRERIVEKLAVLRGLYDDPEAWVTTALRLARDV